LEINNTIDCIDHEAKTSETKIIEIDDSNDILIYFFVKSSLKVSSFFDMFQVYICFSAKVHLDGHYQIAFDNDIANQIHKNFLKKVCKIQYKMGVLDIRLSMHQMKTI